MDAIEANCRISLAEATARAAVRHILVDIWKQQPNETEINRVALKLLNLTLEVARLRAEGETKWTHS